MKPRKVKRVAFHIGVNIDSNVRTSLDAEKHRMVLTKDDAGVTIKEENGEETFVWGANCHWAKLEREVIEPDPEEAEADKPRRGRPPKATSEPSP